MANSHDTITRWMDVIQGRKDRQLSCGNIKTYEPDRIYSYGSHFEMARVIRDKEGQPNRVLQNGDRWGSTTNRHQSEVRSVVQCSGFPTAIIPYQALTAAGIDLNSVEFIDVSADRTEVRQHTSATEPAGSQWRVREICEYRPLSTEQIAAKMAKMNADVLADWERRKGWAEKDPESYWAKDLARHPEPPTPMAEDSLGEWERKVWTKIGEVRELWVGYNEVTLKDDIYSWSTNHHWLGESLIRVGIPESGFTACKPHRRANRRHWDCEACKHWRRVRTAYFLSGFDHAETRPLYFLCELPKSARPTTIPEAYEALKPEAVKLAERMGRPIVRQGDIFALSLKGVSMRTLRKGGATFAKRGNLLGTNHEATEVGYLPDGTTIARGVLYHNPSGREPDHRRRKLTEGWSVIIKNTVPTTKGKK